jgi:hypothetical protein
MLEVSQNLSSTVDSQSLKPKSQEFQLTDSDYTTFMAIDLQLEFSSQVTIGNRKPQIIHIDFDKFVADCFSATTGSIIGIYREEKKLQLRLYKQKTKLNVLPR